MIATFSGRCKVIPGIRSLSLSAQLSCVNNSWTSEEVTWENAKPYDSIPGPKPLPIPKIGNFWRFTKFGPYGNLDSERMLKTMREEFGDIFRLTGIGSKDIVFLSDKILIEKMFRHEYEFPVRDASPSLTHYQQRYRTDVFSPTLSLSQLQGENWKEARSMVNPVLMQANSMKPYVSQVEGVADELIERMKKLRDDKMELIMTDELAKWTLETIGRVAYDMRFGFLTDEKCEEALKLANAIRGAVKSIYQLDLMPSLWKYVSTPAYKKFVQNWDFVVDFHSKCVKETYKRMEERKGSKGYKPGCLMETVLESTDLKLADPLLSDLISASNTIGETMVIILLHVANHPEKQEKLFQEVKSILPEKSTTLTFAALQNMNYLRATIKESLRLRPIIPGNSRSAVRNFVLGGYRIPKGTAMVGLNLITSVDEKNFREADKFIPERWLTEEMKYSNPDDYESIPFGSGSRMCIGRKLVNIEIETLLTKIIRNFKISCHEEEMEWKLLLTLTPVKPPKFTIIDRHN